jgi:MFS family permease
VIRREDTGLGRDYWILWTGVALNRTCTFVAPFLALYLATADHMRAGEIGLLLSLQGAGALVSKTVGGLLTDYIGPKPTMLLSLTSFGLAVSLLAYAPNNLAFTVPFLLGVGLTQDMFRPASAVLTARLVSRAQRNRAYANLSRAVNVGFALSGLLAAVLVTKGIRFLFVLDAITCVLYGVIVALAVRTPRSPAAEPRRQASAAPAGDLPSARAETKSREILLWLTSTAGAYWFVYLAAYALLPLFIKYSGHSASLYAIVLACSAVTIILTQGIVVNLAKRFGRLRCLTASAVFLGVGFGPLAFLHQTAVLLIAIIICSLGESLASGFTVAIIADIAPEAKQGRYQATHGLAISVPLLIAPAAGGFIYQRAGPSAFWISCTVLAIAGALGYLLLRRNLDPALSPIVDGSEGGGL